MNVEAAFLIYHGEPSVKLPLREVSFYNAYSYLVFWITSKK